VSFYHLFSLKSKGEHTCLVYTGTACYLKGAQLILNEIKKGFYRIVPLARLNIATKMKMLLAQKEFEIFKVMNGGKPVHSTFDFHYSGLIEALGDVEIAEK